MDLVLGSGSSLPILICNFKRYFRTTTVVPIATTEDDDVVEVLFCFYFCSKNKNTIIVK